MREVHTNRFIKYFATEFTEDTEENQNHWIITALSLCTLWSRRLWCWQ